MRRVWKVPWHMLENAYIAVNRPLRTILMAAQEERKRAIKKRQPSSRMPKEVVLNTVLLGVCMVSHSDEVSDGNEDRVRKLEERLSLYYMARRSAG